MLNINEIKRKYSFCNVVSDTIIVSVTDCYVDSIKTKVSGVYEVTFRYPSFIYKMKFVDHRH